jgi:hypothetical protein
MNAIARNMVEQLTQNGRSLTQAKRSDLARVILAMGTMNLSTSTTKNAMLWHIESAMKEI